MTTTAYVVAQRDKPTIVCPAWCDLGVESHLEDLEGLEGMVMHSGGRDGLMISQETFVDGTPGPETPEPIFDVDDPFREYVTAAEILKFADTIRAVVTELASAESSAPR